VQPTLEKAIVERFESIPDLVEACGSLTFGKIPDLRTMPGSESPGFRYTVFLENGPVTRRRTTGSPQAKGVEYRFLCHAEDHGICRLMRQALEDAFDYRESAPNPPIEWERGRTCGDGGIMAGDEGMDPNEFTDPRGRKVVVHFLDLMFLYEST
jgi:hypothetical protein